MRWYPRHQRGAATAHDLYLLAESGAAGEQSFSYDPFYYGPKAVTNNFGFAHVQVLEGNLGYLQLTEINLSEQTLPVLMAAMQFVVNTRGLIIDLRNNGGGGSAIGHVLESYFLPKETPLLHFRTRHSAGETARTVQRYHYQTTDELNEHLQAFLLTYNHAKRLKTLRGLTPHEFVCAQWQKNPTIFTRDPTHLTLGLYI